MKQTLMEAHNYFMRVSVKGEDLEPMYLGLLKLTQVINSIPDPQEKEEEIDEVSDPE